MVLKEEGIPMRLVLQVLSDSWSYALKHSGFFFLFLQYTFTSPSPFSIRALYSELPENICGFYAALGALGIQPSEVCSLRRGCLETA